MSSYTVTEISDLDGNVLAWNCFDRPMRPLATSWDWAKRALAEVHECDPDDIECIEPEDDDPQRDDYMAIGGKCVAIYRQRFPTYAEVIEREFPEASFQQAAE